MEIKQKLFTEKQVSASGFFGGPIPPGILMYKNLLRLGREREAHVTLASTFIFSLGFIVAAIKTPTEIFDKIPSQVFPAIIGLLVWGLYRLLFGDTVKEKLDEGASKESNRLVTGWTFGGMITYLILLFGVALVEPAFPGDKISFDGNEIYFDSPQTSEKEVKKLASQLYSIEYFSGETYNAVRISKNQSGYDVQIPIDKEFWEDSEIMDVLFSLKWLLEADLENDVSIFLEHYELNGQTLTKRI